MKFARVFELLLFLEERPSEDMPKEIRRSFELSRYSCRVRVAAKGFAIPRTSRRLSIRRAWGMALPYWRSRHGFLGRREEPSVSERGRQVRMPAQGVRPRAALWEAAGFKLARP